MDVKTITSRELKQITETFCEKQKYIMWHGKRILINPLLSFKETFELIGEIIKSCVNEEKNAVVLESVDFAFRAKIINKYGNIILPNEVEDQFKIIYGTDIFNVIVSEINISQLKMIKNVIESYTSIKLNI